MTQDVMVKAAQLLQRLDVFFCLPLLLVAGGRRKPPYTIGTAWYRLSHHQRLHGDTFECARSVHVSQYCAILIAVVSMATCAIHT